MDWNKYCLNLKGKNIIGSVMFLFLFVYSFGQGGITTYNMQNSGIGDNSVNAVCVTSDGKVWAGTDNGLYSFDGTNWDAFTTTNSGLPSNSVRSLIQDDSGYVWVGTFTNGLARFDGQDWINYHTGNSILPEDHVRSLAAIPGGGVWIGTLGGLSKLKNGVMTTYTYVNQGSESNNVACIGVEDTNVVWLGMVNGGLIRQSDTGFVDYTINNSSLTDNTILGIAMEGDDLWMATPAGGVVYYWNLAFISYHPFNSGSPSSTYNSVVMDPQSDLWLGSLDSGVVYYDRNNWRSFNSFNSAFPQNYVRALKYDAQRDAIWVGTHSAGLVKLDRSIVLSSEPMEGTSALKVFPQPCSDQLNIRLPDVKNSDWMIVDIFGRVVREGRMLGGKVSIDVQNLPRGSYILRVEQDSRLIIME